MLLESALHERKWCQTRDKIHNKAHKFTERPRAPGGTRVQENNQQPDGVMRRNCCYLPF